MTIIWTDFAIKNLKEIFDYYAENATKKVAQKIKKQILLSTKQLTDHPESGQIESNLQKLDQDHRYLVSGNYKIIYRIDQHQVIISDVFDTRQEPIKMNDSNRMKK
jgi:addiction module RelE/StbE family toxin